MTGMKYVVVMALGVTAASVGMAAAGQQQRSDGSNPPTAARYRLTGTFQLESTRGDDPRRAADLAARGLPADQRQLISQRLRARLEAPARIAIERNGNIVTMASSRAQRVTFDADGNDRSERWSDERTMNTRTSFEGERLVVATTGNRGSAFTVIFDPTGNGLQMTRTIDDERLQQPVTVRSFYRRVSDDARWNIDTSGEPGPDNNAGLDEHDFVVPDGTRFVASLDSALSTTDLREGDVYTMTARSPMQYQGAVIQGFVSTLNQARRVPGRSGMTLNLQSIRLRDGSSYQFDGTIEGVRTPDGDTVRMDREGSVDHRDSQTQKMVERGVIGAALGAIIGAVAGGPRGAAIGAVIGASGGAGTVIIEGRDRLDLQRGTEVTIISGDPRNRRMTPGGQR